jgi:hypothetical protein
MTELSNYLADLHVLPHGQWREEKYREIAIKLVRKSSGSIKVTFDIPPQFGVLNPLSFLFTGFDTEDYSWLPGQFEMRSTNSPSASTPARSRSVTKPAKSRAGQVSGPTPVKIVYVTYAVALARARAIIDKVFENIHARVRPTAGAVLLRHNERRSRSLVKSTRERSFNLGVIRDALDSYHESKKTEKKNIKKMSEALTPKPRRTFSPY